MPRSFRHQTCDTVTDVPVEVLATILRGPHLVADRILCAQCGRRVPLAECVWVESGQDLASWLRAVRDTPIHREPTGEGLDWPDETEDRAGGDSG